MLTVSSEQFKEQGREAKKSLKTRGLDEQLRAELKIKTQCAEVLSKVEAATGGRVIDVVTKKDPGSQNMAACADFIANKIYLTEETLAANDNSWAIYAGRHEMEHLTNRIRGLDIQKGLSIDHKSALQNALKTTDLDVDVMEGFNDLSTIKKHGKNKRSGYLQKEVPFAEKLEEICKKTFGYSLLQTFQSGNEPLFIHRVRKLADYLLCVEALAEHKKQKGSFLLGGHYRALGKSIKQNVPAVSDRADADRVIQKLYSQEAEIGTIRSLLEA